MTGKEIKKSCEEVFEKYGITDASVKLLPCAGSDPEYFRYKQKKELLGETILRERCIFTSVYGVPKRAVKVSDKEKQKKGVDFIFDNKNIDLKSEVGEYREFGKDIVAIEITQNGKFSPTDDKETDYMLYLNVNLESKTLVAISIPYNVIKEIAKVNLERDTEHKYYVEVVNSSLYGNGTFVKFPIERIINLIDVNIIKTKL